MPDYSTDDDDDNVTTHHEDDGYYLYGFTEAAFNFQSNNFGNGGRGNDPVSIAVQDAAGVDNTDFSTPGDLVTCIPEQR
ncbi:hypothetical protein BDZ89DRAFT_1140362 [Hymenopellis radicata]|nr:hypothetical protein BDZ89DRAFT_1140362 [Hymenopellis radicata]